MLNTERAAIMLIKERARQYEDGLITVGEALSMISAISTHTLATYVDKLEHGLFIATGRRPHEIIRE